MSPAPDAPRYNFHAPRAPKISASTAPNRTARARGVPFSSRRGAKPTMGSIKLMLVSPVGIVVAEGGLLVLVEHAIAEDEGVDARSHEAAVRLGGSAND